MLTPAAVQGSPRRLNSMSKGACWLLLRMPVVLFTGPRQRPGVNAERSDPKGSVYAERRQWYPGAATPGYWALEC